MLWFKKGIAKNFRRVWNQALTKEEYRCYFLYSSSRIALHCRTICVYFFLVRHSKEVLVPLFSIGNIDVADKDDNKNCAISVVIFPTKKKDENLRNKLMQLKCIIIDHIVHQKK